MRNFILAGLFIFSLGFVKAQQTPNSKNDVYMEPSELVKELKLPENQKPLVLDIGFLGKIKDAVKIAPANDDEGLKKLKGYLKDVPKDREIVIYCGCCPMDKCPNVQPAFKLLQKEGFTNVFILNLADNLKTDWVSKGYPMDDDK